MLISWMVKLKCFTHRNVTHQVYRMGEKSHGAGGLADCPSSLFFLAASYLSSAQGEKKDFCPQSKDK